MNPLVSVVLPVYNCPHYVEVSIESILAQSCTNFELVVIDDGSTDRTPEVLRQYDDPRMRLVTQENRGLAGTLNRGIELARGQYIARQDQDDFSFSGAIGETSRISRCPSSVRAGWNLGGDLEGGQENQARSRPPERECGSEIRTAAQQPFCSQFGHDSQVGTRPSRPLQY